jgi:hypothetical protein
MAAWAGHDTVLELPKELTSLKTLAVHDDLHHHSAVLDQFVYESAHLRIFKPQQSSHYSLTHFGNIRKWP